MEDSSASGLNLSIEDKHFGVAEREKKRILGDILSTTEELLKEEASGASGVKVEKIQPSNRNSTRRDDDGAIKRKTNETPEREKVHNRDDEQSVSSGLDSDAEANDSDTASGAYSQIPKTYDPSIDNRLPDTVKILTTPDGGKLYLVGTAHFSEESQKDVRTIVQAVQPSIIMVELCKSRVHVLHLDEKTILEEVENLSFRTICETIQQNGVFNGMLYFLLLNMSAYLTRQLGMAPGGEFRCAFAEAQKIPNCIIHLGDRPINITLQRAFSSLGWWQTLKLGWHLSTTNDPISKEDIECWKRQDMLEELLKSVANDYPSIEEVFIKERDLYLTYSLQLACYPQQTRNGWEPVRVVGVVGIGHMKGIIENWGKVQSSEIVPIMRIPAPSRSSRIFRKVVKLSIYGAVLYVGYKIIPIPSGITVQSIKSSVEGLLKVSISR